MYGRPEQSGEGLTYLLPVLFLAIGTVPATSRSVDRCRHPYHHRLVTLTMPSSPWHLRAHGPSSASCCLELSHAESSTPSLLVAVCSDRCVVRDLSRTHAEVLGCLAACS